MSTKSTKSDTPSNPFHIKAPRVPAGDKQLTVIVPARIVSQLKQVAVDNEETLRIVVLRALRTAGYDVSDSDLIDRRGPAARERREAWYASKVEPNNKK